MGAPKSIPTSTQGRRSSESRGLLGAVYLTCGLAVGTMLFPAFPFIVLALASLVVLAAIAISIPMLVRKFAREATERGGFFSAWNPSPSQGVLLALETLVVWVPFGLLSVIVFWSNGLLMSWLEFLTDAAIRKARGGLPPKEAFEAPWPFSWIPGVQGTSEALGAGFAELGEVLSNALFLLKWVFVVESSLGIAFFAWLTLRSVTYIYLRLAVCKSSTLLTTRFDMGLLR